LRNLPDTDRILGSLTALGLTLLGTSAAQAGEVNVNQDVTELMGVLNTPSSSFTLSLPGTDTFVIHAENSTAAKRDPRFISMQEIGYGRVKTMSSGRWSVVNAAGLGAKWGTIAGNATSAGTLAGNTSMKSHKAFAAGHYTDAYFAFTFKDTADANQLDYGWLELSLVHNGYTNLDVDVVAYAWEPDGAQLGMGQAPSDATPEPGSLGTMAIGAMILGAAGVRRWKAVRKTQETAA
jgi:hypothetical protein